MSPLFVVYEGLTAVAALAVTIAAASTQSVGDWMPVLVLVALTAITEHFAFQLPTAGSVSLSFALSYGALLYAGPVAGIVCGLAGATNMHEHRAGKPVSLRLFNAAQLVLAVGAAGLLYRALGGVDLAQGDLALGGSLLPGGLAALAFYALNTALVAGGASILHGISFRSCLRDMGFLAYGSSLVVLALLGYLLAYLMALHSWLGVLLLVLPFMATRRVFRVYVELSTAYSETVRSLMAAIEAKDPYTRGHSERVAAYARRLGEAIGVSRSDADLLERAGLLHDVGKIGISIDTLTSHARLSPDEVRAIKMHPLLGAEVVAEIEFLGDAVPIIRHHHERIDGAGYPDGKYGETIPRLARVLAVADSYDAMTSDRAYRPAMSQEAAVEEMLRVSGSQLDASLVASFVKSITANEDGADGR